MAQNIQTYIIQEFKKSKYKGTASLEHLYHIIYLIPKFILGVILKNHI